LIITPQSSLTTKRRMVTAPVTASTSQTQAWHEFDHVMGDEGV